MSCPYSEEELAEWDSVCNPMGEPCYDCDEYRCDHFAGIIPDYVDIEYFDDDIDLL